MILIAWSKNMYRTAVVCGSEVVDASWCALLVVVRFTVVGEAGRGAHPHNPATDPVVEETIHVAGGPKFPIGWIWPRAHPSSAAADPTVRLGAQMGFGRG